MQIFVDADACPVVFIVEAVEKIWGGGNACVRYKSHIVF